MPRREPKEIGELKIKSKSQNQSISTVLSGDRSSIYHSQRMYGGGTRELVPVKRRKKQAPQQEVWDRLGEPSGKFSYYDASDSAPSESRKVFLLSEV